MHLTAWFDDLLQDARWAVRSLRRSPSFTLVAVLTLALGIGITTAVFGVLNAVLLRSLPYAGPDRIVSVVTTWTDSPHVTPRLTAGDYTDIASHDVFEAASVCYGGQIGVSVGSTAEFAGVYFVHAPFFSVFDERPAYGRVFDAREPGQAVVVSHGFAVRHFGAAGAAIGRTIRIDGQPYAIAGVMRQGFAYPRPAEVWAPAPVVVPSATLDRTAYNYPVVARLRAGLSADGATARLRVLGARLGRAFPDTNRTKSFAARPLLEGLIADVRPTLYLLFGAVLVLLLIASVNISSLQLARATARRREIAVRAALGASRTRLVRQFFVESFCLALAGGAAGVALAWVITHAAPQVAPASLPRADEIRVDWTVLAFACVASMLASVVFGLLPAWHAADTDDHRALDGGSRTIVGGRAVRARSILVVAEIAAAVVLAIAGALLVRSFGALSEVDLGFRPERVLVVYAHAPASTDDQYVRVAQAITDAAASLGRLPGVSSAAAAMGLPAGDYSSFGQYAVEGIHRFAPGERLPQAGFRLASPGYFATIGVPLLRGPDFSASDRFDTTPVAIVSAALARQTFGAADPIGRRIQCGLDRLDPMVIVGVVGDLRHDSPASTPEPELYMPLTQHPSMANEVQFVMRTAANPFAVSGTARDALSRALPGAALRATTLEAMIADSIATPRVRMVLVSLFAALALLLATIGVFGVMSYSAAQRVPEYGLRLALGAEPVALVRRVLGQAVRIGITGLVLGIALAVAGGRVLQSMLFGVTPLDPLTYAGVAVAILTVTGGRGSMARLACIARRSDSGTAE